MQRIVAGVSLALALSSSALAEDIGGKYVVGGTNFDGSAYSGTAEITRSGGTCRIVWHTGPVPSQGVCMASNKAFAAFYKLGPEYGLVVYELQDDGSLKGQWSIPGKPGIGTETLVPRK